MIVCHEKEIIFVKTKKTGGTSFETAISKFCGPDCIITPITPADEKHRAELGYRTAQNFQDYVWKQDGVRTNGQFYNHMPACDVKRAVPPRIWQNYKKITILRSPFDVAISKYYWKGGERTGMDFPTYLQRFPTHLLENLEIAPLTGECQLDFYLKYEDLQAEFTRAGIDFMWDAFSGIRAKGNTCPKQGSAVEDMYRKYPEAAELVKQVCAQEIAALGYELAL